MHGRSRSDLETMGGSSRRLHTLHMVLHMLHMLGVNGTYAAVVEASSIYGIPVCFAHNFVRMQGRNTLLDLYFPKILCWSLSRSPINQNIAILTPRALPLPSHPLAGTPNALPCLSLVCVCLCVAVCACSAPRDSALYLCTRSMTRSLKSGLSDACRRACLCARD